MRHLDSTDVHPTTGFAPFSLMFGRQARLPVDIALGTSPPLAVTVPEYMIQLQDSLEFSYRCVRNKMGHQLQHQKTLYDRQKQGCPFNAGDWVWLHNPAVPRGRSRKLHRPWTGPHRVRKRLSEVVYCLQHLQRPRYQPVVHFNRLKRYPERVRLPQGSGRAVKGSRKNASVPLPVGSRVELLDDDMPTSGFQPPPASAAIESQVPRPTSTPQPPLIRMQ